MQCNDAREAAQQKVCSLSNFLEVRIYVMLCRHSTLAMRRHWTGTSDMALACSLNAYEQPSTQWSSVGPEVCLPPCPTCAASEDYNEAARILNAYVISTVTIIS